jgi:hypothetical protein
VNGDEGKELKLPPLGISNIDIHSVMEFEKSRNMMSRERTIPLNTPLKSRKKMREPIFPELVEEVSVDSVDFIDHNK